MRHRPYRLVALTAALALLGAGCSANNGAATTAMSDDEVEEQLQTLNASLEADRALLRSLWDQPRPDKPASLVMTDQQQTMLDRMYYQIFEQLSETERENATLLWGIVMANESPVDAIPASFDDADPEAKKALTLAMLPWLKRYAQLVDVSLPWEAIALHAEPTPIEEREREAGKADYGEGTGKKKPGAAPTPKDPMGTKTGGTVKKKVMQVIAMGFSLFGYYTRPADWGNPDIGMSVCLKWLTTTQKCCKTGCRPVTYWPPTPSGICSGPSTGADQFIGSIIQCNLFGKSLVSGASTSSESQ